MHQPGLSADLDSFDLLDLIQVIQMAQRDLSLVVRAGSQVLGTLRFAQGELLWAEFGELRGEEAFIALAAQHSGSIEQLPWDGRNERNVNQPLARLIIQAVEYRDAHAAPQAQHAQESEAWNQPGQPMSLAQPLMFARERLTGSEGHTRPGGTPQAPKVAISEDDAVPSWVREIQSASEGISAQATSTMPPLAPAATPPDSTPSLSPALSPSSFSSPPPPFSPAPTPLPSQLEEIDSQNPQPTLPLSALNGRLLLPSLSSGSRANAQPFVLSEEDPPTVPLPTVQGGLLEYASKREYQSPEPPREALPQLKMVPGVLPEQAITVRSPAAEDTPPAQSLAPMSPSVSLMPTTPLTLDEPKLSSLSILEQLAYGGLASNGHAGMAASPVSMASAVSAPETPGVAALAPLSESIKSQPSSSRLRGDTAGGQNGKALHEPASAPPLAGRIASSLPDAQAASAQTALSVDVLHSLQQALEVFAGQVGTACVATAVIRTDGSLVAEYRARSSQEQELASPAYHLAHVMQSSLRALLMGAWGDLEDTIITGSTHSVMLRRLGRPEKGLFHVAVLERSGNPGLCRVRMRNSEAALLQKL